jgi:rubrerythrin
MISPETERILLNLFKIETGLSRIYEHLSKKEGFTDPVKTFWVSMMNEELGHAEIFNNILERAKVEKSLELDIDIDSKELKEFVDKVNSLLDNIKNETISESEAYSFGSLIEAELDEARFTKKVSSDDENVTTQMKQIENDTQKHRLILVNYSRGIR